MIMSPVVVLLGSLLLPPPQDGPWLRPPVIAAADQQLVDQSKALLGMWKVTWYGEDAQTGLRIDRATPVGESVEIAGMLESQGRQVCPFTGRLAPSFAGSYGDQIMMIRHITSAYVTIEAACPTEKIEIELLGLPGGPVLMSGRADMTSGNGRDIVPVFIGR
jgi:hypothetical protein